MPAIDTATPGVLAAACELALRPLVGQRFRKLGRAGLVWLSFGDEREVETLRGGTRIVNRYALHLQCPFRLRDASAVLVAASDRYADRVNPQDTNEDFDWDPIGASWFDLRAEVLNGRLDQETANVRSVEVDPVGGFRLALDGGLVLDVLPATSYPREHWRIFEYGAGGMHFVLFERDYCRGPTPSVQ